MSEAHVGSGGQRDSTLRASLGLAATLPALLGAHLREPIMELQAVRVHRPSVRSRGLHHDERAAERTAARGAGSLRYEATVSLNRERVHPVQAHFTNLTNRRRRNASSVSHRHTRTGPHIAPTPFR